MLIDIILLGVGLIALTAGSYTDIRTREVPDWISYGLIFAGIGIRLVYSMLTFDFTYLTYGFFGLGIFVAIGYIMFYAGQWGGGDSKLLMGLGLVFGMPFYLTPLPLLLVFLINVVLVGAVYGLLYSIILAVINREKFVEELKKIFNDEKIIKYRKFSLILISLGILAIIFLLEDTIIIWTFITFLAFAYLSFYLVIFVKGVEKSAMYKLVEPSKLTEGDWIAKDYVIDKKKICGPKDLGVSKLQIKHLIELKRKKKIGKIQIKEGIPFVPSFLIAYVISLIFGGWFLAFI